MVSLWSSSSDSLENNDEIDCTTSSFSGNYIIRRSNLLTLPKRVKVLMDSEIASSVDWVSLEAWGYSSVYRDEEAVRRFREGKTMSSTGNEDDLVPDFCRAGEPFV